MDHIRKCLPDLKQRVSEMKANFKNVLTSCGEPTIDKRSTLLRIINKFSAAYSSAIIGNSKSLETEELLVAFILYFH